MTHVIINSSFKSILLITIPVLLSAMSANLMLVVDRIMLANFSVDAMNAVMASGNLVVIFTLMFIGIASTAEVFVGQYNGSKQYTKLAIPVWQMIYLSCLSLFIFLPLAYFADVVHWLPQYYVADGVAYQRILLYFGFEPVLTAALTAFFIGQGKTKIVTSTVLIGVILNVILDYIFIYVINPSLGSSGAAWATVISEGVQVLILAIRFLSAKNRVVHQVLRNIKYNKNLFLGCVKMGVPISLGHCISLCGWYLLQSIMSHVSKDCATVYSIGANFYTIFIFVGEGLHKAIAAIAANMIARRDIAAIKRTLRIFVCFAAAFCILLALSFAILPNVMFGALDLLQKGFFERYPGLKMVLTLDVIVIFFDSLLSIIWGVLMAGGDTKYPIIVNITCLWVFVVLPTIILYSFDLLTSATTPYYLMLFWCTTSLFFIYRRYKSLKWYNVLV
jgi:MATE family multidrug resistance protein